MLKNGQPNPLNIHGLRRLDWAPPHFTQVIIESVGQEKIITDWLYENLIGRFYVGVIDIPSTTSGGKFFKDRRTMVAFEIANEASYFSMFLPNLLNAHNAN